MDQQGKILSQQGVKDEAKFQAFVKQHDTEPQALSFDSLTKELNARRAQTGMQPVKPVEPKVIQLSPEEKGRQLTETGEPALAWQQRQSERLGEILGCQQDDGNSRRDQEDARQHPGVAGTPRTRAVLAGNEYDEMQYRREAQAGLELEQKLVGWADKKVGRARQIR